MSSAQVHSLERLLDFQASLATYCHQAKEALTSIEMELRRTQQWLEERMQSWQAEVRRLEEEVFKAKQELARRRLVRIGDRPADTTEQEITLAKAQARLHHAEEKRAACRRWLRELPDAIAEYDGHAVNCQTLLESDVPRMLAFLDRKMDLLEAYAQIAASDAPPGEKP
jgi:DNA repair exonuclease SbcCD ATPase subunit